MNQEYLEQFETEHLIPAVKKKLLDLERDFTKNRVQLSQHFVQEIAQCAENCKWLQEEGKLGKVGYLVPTLLRTRIQEGRFSYVVFAYDELFYLKDGVQVGQVSAEFCYRYYQELCEEILKDKHSYMGNIKQYQIELLLHETVKCFHEYMIQLMRASIQPLRKEKRLLEILREEDFIMGTGELLEKLDMVYKERVGERDIFELRAQIEDKENMDFADLRKFPIPNLSFTGMSLTYSDFTDSELSGFDFSNSMLQGANFTRCNLQNTSFLHTKLSEADFTGADLTGACMIGVYASVGLEREDDWIQPGRLPVCFDGASLRGTDFTNAYLIGVDLRTADLEHAKFKGAVLTNCKITREQIWKAHFSEEQIDSMEVTD